MKLYAPESYVNAPKSVRQAVVNGCGAGGWKFDLVPDTMYGLDISEACNIHDWMYHEGSTIEDKESADRAFLNNLLRIIDDGSSFKIMKWLRHRRALKYFEAVSLFGGPAFWADKNKPSEILTVKGKL